MSTRDMNIDLPPPALMKFSQDQPSLTMTPKLVPRFLVVDNNKMQAYAAKVVFERRGMCVSLCFDGQQAVDVLDKEAFDAVFMDIELPVMSGIEVCARIRAAEARAKTGHRKMLIFGTVSSVLNTPDCVAFCRDSGMDRYVMKPLVMHVPMFLSMFSTGGSSIEKFRYTTLNKRWVSRYEELHALLSNNTSLGAPEFAHFVNDEASRRQLEMIASYGEEGTERAELLKFYTREKAEDLTCLRYKNDVLQREIWDEQEKSKGAKRNLLGAKMMKSVIRPAEATSEEVPDKQKMDDLAARCEELAADLQQTRADLKGVIEAGKAENKRRARLHKAKCDTLISHLMTQEHEIMLQEESRSMCNKDNYRDNFHKAQLKVVSYHNPSQTNTDIIVKPSESHHPLFTFAFSYFRHELTAMRTLIDGLAARRLTQEKRGLDAFFSAVIKLRSSFPEDVLALIVQEVKQCQSAEDVKNQPYLDKAAEEMETVVFKFLERENDLWTRQALGDLAVITRSHDNFPVSEATQTSAAARDSTFATQQHEPEEPFQVTILRETVDDLRTKIASLERGAKAASSALVTSVSPLVEEVSALSSAVLIPSLEVEHARAGDAGAVLERCEAVMKALLFSLKHSLTDTAEARTKVDRLTHELAEAQEAALRAATRTPSSVSSTPTTETPTDEAAESRSLPPLGSSMNTQDSKERSEAKGGKKARPQKEESGRGPEAKETKERDDPNKARARTKPPKPQRDRRVSQKPDRAVRDADGRVTPETESPLDATVPGTTTEPGATTAAAPNTTTTTKTTQPKVKMTTKARRQSIPTEKEGAVPITTTTTSNSNSHSTNSTPNTTSTTNSRTNSSTPAQLPAESTHSAAQPTPLPPARETTAQVAPSSVAGASAPPLHPTPAPNSSTPVQGKADIAVEKDSNSADVLIAESLTGTNPLQGDLPRAEAQEMRQESNVDTSTAAVPNKERKKSRFVPKMQPLKRTSSLDEENVPWGGVRSTPVKRVLAANNALLDFGVGEEKKEKEVRATLTTGKDIKAFFRKHAKAMEGQLEVAGAGRKEEPAGVITSSKVAPQMQGALCMTGEAKLDAGTPTTPVAVQRASWEGAFKDAQGHRPSQHEGIGSLVGGGVTPTRAKELQNIQGYLYPKPPSSGKQK